MKNDNKIKIGKSFGNKLIKQLYKEKEIISVTIVGSFTKNYNLNKIGDLDIVIICKKITPNLIKKSKKKIKILKSNPFGVLLFYDKGQKIQLRISGKTKVNYQNEITKKSWKKTAHMSRQCYLGDFSPGLEASKPTSGLSESIDNLKYSFEESEFGYKNFSVVEVVIKSIEWLYLAAKGHRRAYFQFKNGEISKKWLIP